MSRLERCKEKTGLAKLFASVFSKTEVLPADGAKGIYAFAEGEKVRLHRVERNEHGKSYYEDAPGELEQMRREGTLTALDEKVVCLLAENVCMTAEQLSEELEMSGEKITITDLELRLYELTCSRILQRIDFQMPKDSEVKPAISCAYRIDYLGSVLAREKGVVFHKGNMYRTGKQRREHGMPDTPVEIKRVLAGNAIRLAMKKIGVPADSCQMMQTIFVTPVKQGDVECITRSAFTARLGADSVLIYDVVRDDDSKEYQKFILNKVKRFQAIVDREDFMEHNSFELTCYPQLVLCCENKEHAMKLREKLVEAGLPAAQSRMQLLFTEDGLLNASGIRKSVYQLNPLGERTWFEIVG